MKTAIVTGASGNLGQAVIKKLIDENYFVIGTVTPNNAMQINFPDDKFEKIAVDLMNEADAQHFIDAVIAKHKCIDAAILTVGGFATGNIADTKTADILKQYKLNFETAYNVARPSFMQMIKQNSGRIFLIGSKPGLDAENGKDMVAYSLAKSPIFRLAAIMNEEAKGKDVVTSVIVPAIIDTPQNRKAMPAANFNDWVKPESIANIIYWHCTAEAAAIREPVIKVYNHV